MFEKISNNFLPHFISQKGTNLGRVPTFWGAQFRLLAPFWDGT